MAHALLKKQALQDERISQQKLIEITTWKGYHSQNNWGNNSNK